MENKKEIQTSKTHYEIIKVKSSEDLLKAVPIAIHKDYVTAQNEIGSALVFCADALGIALEDHVVKIITSDLIEKYKFDSVEDIIYCLKKGRQGYYGKNYAKLNTIVISEWMEHHLESKASAKESEVSKNKAKSTLEIQGVDYDAYKIKLEKQKANKSEEKRNHFEFQKFISTGLKQKIVDCPVCKNDPEDKINCPGCKGHGQRKVMA